MQTRFKQANKEALWALVLTLVYVIFWVFAAYLPDNTLYFLGLPLWFVLSCFFLPLIFIILCILMIKFLYKDIPLDP